MSELYKNEVVKYINSLPIDERKDLMYEINTTSLPTTWQEFCNTHPIREGEYLLGTDDSIYNLVVGDVRNEDDYLILPNKKYAEAVKALCQLIQLRDCYRQGWQPDWTNINQVKYIISWRGNKPSLYMEWDIAQHILSFQTEELRDDFLDNFHDIIEVAKELI